MNYFTSADISARRSRVANEWNKQLKDSEVVLIHCGHPIQKPGGLDQNYPFIPHPMYYWLTGRRRESEVLLYSKNLGWFEFQKHYGKDVSVWEGEKNDLLVNDIGRNVEDLTSFFEEHKFSAIYELGQSGKQIKEGTEFELRTSADRVRRIKDQSEVRFIRSIAGVTAAAYRILEENIRPGISEKELQVIYESELYRNGVHTMPYDSIIGSGKNSAVLHCLPTSRVIGEGELVLVDAGADIFDYCVDITRTYISSRPADTRRKSLYELVLRVQKHCIGMLKPGVMWRDVHKTAATMFTEGLKNFGILKGSIDALLEKQVVSLFFPHGLGHLVGLRVRDVGHEENLNPKFYFGARLRVDMELEEGHLITVEPGLYFIDALLNDAGNRKKFYDEINFEELENWMDIGGVRIEDNMLITAVGYDNLTSEIRKSETL